MASAIESNLLRIFKAIAEENSVSRAAERLNSVQPNISARLAYLEEQLGVQLFYRTSRGMQLTPDGRRLLPYAERVVRTLDDVEREFSSDSCFSGELRLGTTETFAAMRFYDVVRAIRGEYPGLHVRVNTAASSHLVRQLLRYEIDGAFIETDITEPDIACDLLFEDELVLVTGTNGEAVTDWLSQQPTLIGFPSTCIFRTAVEQWLHDQGNYTYDVMEFYGLEAILGCVAAGLGFTGIPRTIAEESGKSFEVYELPARYRRAPLYWAYRRESQYMQVIDAVSGLLARQFNE